LIRLIALALMAAAASIGVAACGGGGGGEDKVRTVVEHLRDSDEAVCGELTDAYLKQLFKNKSNCEKAAKSAKVKNAFDIKSVKVNGDKATVQIQAKKNKGAVSLVKQGGDWKIEAIKASA
jgi:outer membrane lipopolysaccharide assembly protein LptE/RlpB